MVQMSNVCIINGLHMHQIFILELFELHRVQISVQDFVLMGIYFSVSLLWVIGFGTIFELHKMHWINQNWLTILHDQSKIYITIYCQAFVLSNHYSRACFDNFIPTFLASNTQNKTYFHAKIPRSFFGFPCKDMCYYWFPTKICRGKIPEKIWLDIKHFIKQKIYLEFVSFLSGQSLPKIIPNS